MVFQESSEIRCGPVIITYYTELEEVNDIFASLSSKNEQSNFWRLFELSARSHIQKNPSEEVTNNPNNLMLAPNQSNLNIKNRLPFLQNLLVCWFLIAVLCC